MRVFLSSFPDILSAVIQDSSLQNHTSVAGGSVYERAVNAANHSSISLVALFSDSLSGSQIR
jgi:hypothetical protein